MLWSVDRCRRHVVQTMAKCPKQALWSTSRWVPWVGTTEPRQMYGCCRQVLQYASWVDKKKGRGGRNLQPPAGFLTDFMGSQQGRS